MMEVVLASDCVCVVSLYRWPVGAARLWDDDEWMLMMGIALARDERNACHARDVTGLRGRAMARCAVLCAVELEQDGNDGSWREGDRAPQAHVHVSEIVSVFRVTLLVLVFFGVFRRACPCGYRVSSSNSIVSPLARPAASHGHATPPGTATAHRRGTPPPRACGTRAGPAAAPPGRPGEPRSDRRSDRRSIPLTHKKVASRR